MFTDDKGYLITEMVWEEVSDSESLPPQRGVADSAPKKSTSEVAKGADKSKGKPAPVGQKSMTSFFQKKK